LSNRPLIKPVELEALIKLIVELPVEFPRT
jgi:hypothetical protein